MARPEFEAHYAGTSVFVTGHTGFTGGWLTAWLSALGARTTGLALAPATEPALFEAAGIGERCASQIGDIRDVERVRAAMAAAQPQIVFHLAAQPLVSRSFDDPLETFAVNVVGTANVLEAARTVPSVKAVVCVTTDKVYRDEAWEWGYRESDRLGGKDPYSASKAAAEIVTGAYQSTLAGRANGVLIATARGGNIIGGGDWSDNRIVPDFARAHAHGGTLTLRNPDAVRPWQHVLALCHGYLMLGARLMSGEAQAAAAWNFGPRDDEARTVGDLVAALSQAWPGLAIETGEGGFPETRFLRVDSSKARAQLGWRPPIGFDETVRLTADWYKEYYANPQRAAGILAGQIDDYRRLVAAGS